MEKTRLKQIAEAALLAADHPLSLPQLEQLFHADTDIQVSHEDLASALEALQNDCAERGVELVEVASGFRYQVRQDIHPWVSRLWTERPSRYSRALLETLALIAYRQPITRGEIEQVRGVAVSSNIVKTLEEREWVRVVGHRDAPGRPALLGTTRGFLDYFNLKSLDELPPLADILNLEDPQMTFAADDGMPVHVTAQPDTTDADAAANDPEPDAPAADVDTHGDDSVQDSTDVTDTPDTPEPGNDSEETRA